MRSKLVLLALAVALVLAVVGLFPGRGGERTRVVAEEAAVRDGERAAELAEAVAPEETPARRAPLAAADGAERDGDAPEEPVREAATPAIEARSFHGVVLDARNGAPVAGARALAPRGPGNLPPGELTPDEILAEAHADASGRFTLALEERMRSGRGIVVAESYGPGEFRFDDRHGTADLALVIELLPEAGLEVHVSDERGEPVQGAMLEVEWESEPAASGDWILSATQHARWAAASDAGGVAFLRGLPAERELRWRIGADEGRPLRAGVVALAAGEVHVIEVEFGRGARLTGRVLDEQGAPVALGLRCGPVGGPSPNTEPLAQTSSDADGRYAFDDLTPGEYVLALDSNAEHVLLEREPSVTLDRPVVERDLRVARGLELAGRIEGSAEDVGRLVFVHAVGSTAREMAMVQDGAFRLGPLAPGEYEVWATGHEGTTSRVRAAAGRDDLVLVARGVPATEIRIEGAVGEVDLASHDLETGSVTMWDTREARFEQGFAPGRYVLLARDAGGNAAAALLEVEGEHAPEAVVLRLQPAATAVLVHRARDRARRIRLHIGGTPIPVGRHGRLEDELAPGAAWTMSLPPGLLEVELVEDGRVVASAQRVLAPGERCRVELEPR